MIECMQHSYLRMRLISGKIIKLFNPSETLRKNNRLLTIVLLSANIRIIGDIQ
jgi:hypothetical protein